jgi:uncharacterized membrane protein YgcG
MPFVLQSRIFGRANASRSRLLLTLVVALLVAPAAVAQEDWVIERFDIRLDIQRDGSIDAHEALDVDFRGLSRHGIFRDFFYLFDYDEAYNRQYDIRLMGVTDADGRRQQVQSTTEGATRRFRIGDPDRTLSGKQTYRIAYGIGGALNGFPDRDELYWNASGTWPVRVTALAVVVTAPGGAIERVECFQGREGSRERCSARFTPDEATFTATRPLADGEQMTIVAGLRKGVVAEPRPLLVRRPRDITRSFDRTPGLLAAMLAGFLVILGGVATLWWRVGRDRRFVSLHYLSDDTQEERVPLFGADPIVVEFEPPDHLRPAQIGLLLDERADTLDVTATIIDLAVRGYLKITELPAKGWFGRTDWELASLKEPDAGLLEYERIVLKGLFDSKPSRKLSDLKTKFYGDLSKAKSALYRDAVTRKWFPRNPNTTRTISRVGGWVVAGLGVGLTILLGRQWGAGLLGLPVVAGGMALALMSRAMPRRTALGREAMRRALGFARYIRTAEIQQQSFAERANIFTSYLPYAIAIKCVDRWARAFKDIDLQQATAAWYAGNSRFDPGGFSSSLGSFSASVTSTIASTPGGSGGSGFSGGSSGGGGGGGGGGSW